MANKIKDGIYVYDTHMYNGDDVIEGATDAFNDNALRCVTGDVPTRFDNKIGMATAFGMVKCVKNALSHANVRMQVVAIHDTRILDEEDMRKYLRN